MDLINRYLQAVAFWLPEEQRKDIVAELSVDIQSEIEDREAALERPLTNLELEELLKRRGNHTLRAIQDLRRLGGKEPLHHWAIVALAGA